MDTLRKTSIASQHCRSQIFQISAAPFSGGQCIGSLGQGSEPKAESLACGTHAARLPQSLAGNGLNDGQLVFKAVSKFLIYETELILMLG
nr:hypothetical protein [Sphingobium sp. IP1]